MYQQLAQLIRDGVWLKSYIAAVMRVEQEAFTTAYNAMGPTKVGQSTAVSVAVTESATASAMPADRIVLSTNPVGASAQVCLFRNPRLGFASDHLLLRPICIDLLRCS